MELISNRVAYHDGRHNMVPRFINWHGVRWMVFRTAGGHRSCDGRIVMIRSTDMEDWSGPRTVIDTPLDDRDPSIFSCGDRLFATSLSVEREFLDDTRPFEGLKFQGSCRCFASHTEDGENWSKPEQVMPENYAIWWTVRVGDRVYAAVQRRVPDTIDLDGLVKTLPEGMVGLDRPLQFVNRIDRQAELWSSQDGLRWRQVSVICDRDQASETALAVLPDSRMVGFVRHDDHDADPLTRNRPEIVISHPPYRDWRRLYRFGFQTNGPCIGQVGEKLVTCSRAFFEDDRTPLNSGLCRERRRGLIMGTFDVPRSVWAPEITIPHREGPRSDRGLDPSLGFPDVSYAWMGNTENGDFHLAYYEGFKGAPSDIRMARIR